MRIHVYMYYIMYYIMYIYVCVYTNARVFVYFVYACCVCMSVLHTYGSATGFGHGYRGSKCKEIVS